MSRAPARSAHPAAAGSARSTSRSAGRANPARGTRAAAAQATREAILRAATRIFAKRGFDGARVDEISKASRSYDRMIYYYFGSKEGLYVAVLEDLYRRFNDAESKLPLAIERPDEAVVVAVRFMWNYYRRHPEFISLLNDENLHRGRHIAKSPRASAFSPFAMRLLRDALERGIARGMFRATVSARDIYLMIAGMGYFYLGNRHTLSAFLGERTDSPAALAHWEAFIVDAVRRTLAPPDRLPAG